MPPALLETQIGNICTQHGRKLKRIYVMVREFTSLLGKNGYSFVKLCPAQPSAFSILQHFDHGLQ